jgi:hypothetical protein
VQHSRKIKLFCQQNIEASKQEHKPSSNIRRYTGTQQLQNHTVSRQPQNKTLSNFRIIQLNDCLRIKPSAISKSYSLMTASEKNLQQLQNHTAPRQRQNKTFNNLRI